ncbi:putative histone H2A.1 [Platanthera zijinensis]|uniref:Histone H2A n=1 Tax=Platanthera zijinensis TaxID=2320716 RepID=A0AAP0FWN6_9ASPA
MSGGRGSSRKAMRSSSKKKTRMTRSNRAGLLFPVGRIAGFLKHGRYAQRVGASAPVYLAAVMEYLASEVLELAGNVARENKNARITPRHIQLAIRNDTEFEKLVGNVTIPGGGVPPAIHCFLIPPFRGEDD